MDTLAKSFYITGGTLPLDSGSYITRQADADLLDGLQHGEFCYVLTTRQMGKSSLMIRTAHQLRKGGCRVVILDLTAIGQNLTVEQWYAGLIGRIAQQTDREDELLDFWAAHREMGPMQRFVEGLRYILLTRRQAGETPVTLEDSRLVFFIDEIDAVRSLPFSADEFFAGIRECCNRKASEPAFGNLAFCLLGVATPSDLIRDTRVTPFNIGRRIELHDFTPEEAAPLAQGLRVHRTEAEAESLLERVLYWTGGHPYMTQRLCRAVAESLNAGDRSGKQDEIEDAVLVDTLCSQLFLTKSARETDDNLTFVRTRLLHSETDRATLLDLYGQVRRGKRVRDDETNPLCPILRLSGIVKAANGWLVLRNEIYHRVFDAAWIAEHLPDAEIQRQKRAYRLGVMRTATLGSVVVLIMAGLAGFAFRESRNASAAANRAREQEALATSRLSRSYVDAGLRMMEAGNYGGALSPLTEAMTLDKEDAPRMESHRFRFETVMRYCPQLEQMWFTDSPVNSAAVSPNKQWMAAGSENGTVHVWDTTTGRELSLTIRHAARINFLAFHPSGTILATCGNDNKVSLWDLQTLRLRETLNLNCPPDHPFNVASVAWNRSGKRLVIVGWSRLAIWDFAANPDGTSRIVMDDTPKGAGLESAALSDDGQNIAFVAGNFIAQQAQIGGAENEALGRGSAQTLCFNGYHVEYSPDSNHLLVAGAFGGHGERQGAAIYTAIRDFAHKPPTTWERLLPHEDRGVFATYSPDGTRIVTASRDHTARVWNARDGKPLTPFLAHGGIVNHAAFSHDGKWIATASADGKVQVWNARNGDKVGSAMRHAGSVIFVAFGQDNSHLLTAGQDGTVRLWRLPDPTANSLEQFSSYRSGMYFMETLYPVLEEAGRENYELARLSLIDTASGKRTVLDDGLTSHSNHTGFQLREKRSEDGKHSVVFRTHLEANARRRAQVWDLERGVPLGAVREADEAFLSGSGKWVLYQQREGTQWVEATDSGKTLRVVCRPTASPRRNALAFTPDEQSLVMADKVGNVWIEDRISATHRSPMMRHSEEVYRAFYLPDHKTLATLTNNGMLQMWNPESGMAVSAPDKTNNDWTTNFQPVFSPDKKVMMFPHFWRLDAPQPWHLVAAGADSLQPIFSPDSTLFVSSLNGLRVFDARTGKPLMPRMDVGSHEVYMAFSPDSKRLAAGFDDGTVRVFDARTLQPISPLMDNSKPVVNVRFSPSGNQLVTASNNGPLRFWDAATGEAVSPSMPFRGRCDGRQSEWTPDGSQFFVMPDIGVQRWTQPNLSRSLQEMQAYASLLSGQRMDAKLGAVPLDMGQLRAAWKEVRSRAIAPMLSSPLQP